MGSGGLHRYVSHTLQAAGRSSAGHHSPLGDTLPEVGVVEVTAACELYQLGTRALLMDVVSLMLA